MSFERFIDIAHRLFSSRYVLHLERENARLWEENRALVWGSHGMRPPRLEPETRTVVKSGSIERPAVAREGTQIDGPPVNESEAAETAKAAHMPRLRPTWPAIKRKLEQRELNQANERRRSELRATIQREREAALAESRKAKIEQEAAHAPSLNVPANVISIEAEPMVDAPEVEEEDASAIS